MRKLPVFLLLLISVTTYSQKLKDKLQGDWVCTQILDTQGKPTVGKFGASNEYLRFSFSKKSITIAEAPFDEGIEIAVKYNDDDKLIELFSGAALPLPETAYKVVSVDSTQLILGTFNRDRKIIEYHFSNQRLLGKKLPSENIVFDFGTIFIKHIRHTPDPNSRIKIIGTSRMYEYRISNAPENLYPCPLFTYPTSNILASDLTHDIVLPESFKAGETANDLIIAFEVSKGGATNFRVLQGMHPELDIQIITLMDEHRKHWEALTLNGKPVTTTVKLRFGFILVVE